MDAEMLVKVGGARWQKGTMDRVYFNDLPRWYGLDASHYNTGNVSSAALDRSKISNTHARQIEGDLERVKIWYDVVAQQFRGNGPNIDDYFKTIILRIKAAVVALAESAEVAS